MEDNEMAFYYNVAAADAESQKEIIKTFPAITQLSPAVQEKTINAFYTSWKSSSFSKLEDIPFECPSSLEEPSYPLIGHINEVAEFGMLLAKRSLKIWDDRLIKTIDTEELLECLLLHDIDKPLLYSKFGSDVPMGKKNQIAHGVLGAMLLHDLGFSQRVTSIVSTHSPKSPVHTTDDALAFIVHYADLYSADHIWILTGYTPHFARK
jgi:putative nucleotidyltransferase with HDIG domain